MTATCEECGMESVHHGIERFSVRMDSIFRKLFWPLDPVVRRVAPLADICINRLFPILALVFFKTHLATKVTEPDSHSSETAQALWAEAKRREIEMYEARLFGLPRRSFVAKHGGKTLVFEGLPRPARMQRSILWIDDKAEVKKRFQKSGFPVSKGESASSEREALRIFNRLQKPVIVKPKEGSAGRHTTVHIGTETELLQGYRNAALISPYMMIEEELPGPIFRATLVDRKLAGVLQRDPPQVTGDGRFTVRQLVEEENKNPLRRGPVFAEIQIDSAVSKRELLRQGFTPESVLAPGQRARFHFKVNWGVGGTSHDVTSETHPDNKKLFEDIGAYLKEDIVGIDFIIEDIGRSWREVARCGVIECNSLPLIGNHHFPYKGPVRNVAGAVWNLAFPGS